MVGYVYNTADQNEYFMELNISVNDVVIDSFKPILKDILNHGHTHYVFKGGRGSTKSSLVSVAIPLLIIQNPNIHAVCFRKVANTVQTSIFPQVVWGIYQLGLEKLFKIPKTYSTPIEYKPTGQRILFMGLDDPMKVKSIKLPFGYLGITWFEELDQYEGEHQLRTVTQSTMRGGEKFWDFRTFNPPISKDNWANEYAEIAETRSNTLVKHNTYLDVPELWLGKQFIEEAEELKEINERAYQHEYMGIATGTGGDVFDNVSDLDMSQPVEVVCADGVSTKKVPMVETFDQIYCGIDWGFAIDPFRFVKMHFDKKHLDLYIFDEYTTYRTRNEQVFNILYNELKKISRDELVIADSAEEKSVADFKAYGAFIRPARKGPDSVRYGIKWLQGLRNIYIDKRRCPETYEEFIKYEYDRDRNGNFISSYPDADNHCLTGDTEILTTNGSTAIENLVGTTGKVFAYDIENKQFVAADYIYNTGC